jgi:hypothetical protein
MLATPVRPVPARSGAGLNAAAQSADARPGGTGRTGIESDAELLRAIGRDLAAVYAEVLRRPMPANVKALLQHIKAHADLDR